MKTAVIFLLFVAISVPLVSADGILPPGIKTVNADRISLKLSSLPFAFNGSLAYVGGSNANEPSSLYLAIEATGQLTKTWSIFTNNSGVITSQTYTLSPNGTCSGGAQPRGSGMRCTPWVKAIGPQGRILWSSRCEMTNGGKSTKINQHAVTLNGQLLQLSTLSPPNSTSVLTVLRQLPSPPDQSLMQPCRPNGPAMDGAMMVHPLFALPDPLKCTACKAGIGVVLGRICGVAGAAACAEFPPAVPFCSLLAAAACKAGGKRFGISEACSLIRLC